MKAPLLMIAALMGTAAIAQTTPDANAPAGTPPAASTGAAVAPPAAPAASMDATATAPAASMSTMAPTAPPATSDGSLGVANNAQTATDTSNYPVCSRSVTDKCVQRGAAHKARRHH